MKRDLKKDSNKVFLPNEKEALQLVQTILNRRDIPFILVGAYARDLLFSGISSKGSIRKTLDIDFGIRVRNWEAYEEIMMSLLAGGLFTEDKSRRHRLIFKKEVLIDIVPFGKISDSEGNISWPPEHDVSMNVKGFDVAYGNALDFDMGLKDKIKIASAPSLVLLKLIAWDESPENRSHDLEDISFILKNYIDLIGWDSINTRGDKDIYDICDSDYDEMAARITGRDIGRLNLCGLKDSLLGILSEKNKSYYQMISILGIYYFADHDLVRKIISSLRNGINDI
jgi:predicted nucleotidyltransferase